MFAQRMMALRISLGAAVAVLLSVSLSHAEDLDPLAANQRAAETRNLRNALMAQPEKPVPIVEAPADGKLKEFLKKATRGYDNKLVPFNLGLPDKLPVDSMPVMNKAEGQKKFFDITEIPIAKSSYVSPTLKVDYDAKYQDYVQKVAARTLLDLGPIVDKYKLGLSSIGGNPIDRNDNESLSFIVGFKLPTACSGVRVGTDIVLTAAHCICNVPSEISLGPVLGQGASNQGFAVLKTWIPEDAQCTKSQSFYGQDVALVQFKSASPVMSRIPVIRVATKQVIEKLRAGNDTLVIAGYGWRNETLRDFGHKNFIRSPILSVDCGPGQSQKYGCIEGKELVAMDYRLIEGRYYGVGPCHGDSGGAALAYMDDPETPAIDPQYFLVAVVSRSIAGASACGDGAIYTLLNGERVAVLQSAATKMTGRDFSFAEVESVQQIAAR